MENNSFEPDLDTKLTQQGESDVSENLNLFSKFPLASITTRPLYVSSWSKIEVEGTKK